MTAPEMPADLSAEAAILGGVLLRPKIAGWLDLPAEAMHHPAHRAVWRAMRRLAGRGVPVDTVTLESELRADGALEAVGGLAFLAELAERVPTTANVVHYAAAVRRHWVTRQTLLAVSDAPALAESESGDDLRDELIARLARVDGAQSRERWVALADAVAAEQARLRDPAAPAELLDTGIPGIRIPVGVTTAIGALPSVGKTAFLLAMARGVARSTGGHVGVLLYEDRAPTLARRALADLAEVNGAMIRSRELSLLDMRAVMAAQPRPEDARVHVRHAHGQRMAWSLREATALAFQHPVKLLILDYIQRVPSPAGGVQRDEAVQRNCYEFDAWVARQGCAGVLASQLRQEVEREGSGTRPREPRLTDLAYSQAISQVVKLALLLHPVNEATLRVYSRKNSEGQRYGEIDLRFNKALQRFSEVQEEPLAPMHGGGD